MAVNAPSGIGPWGHRQDSTLPDFNLGNPTSRSPKQRPHFDYSAIPFFVSFTLA